MQKKFYQVLLCGVLSAALLVCAVPAAAEEETPADAAVAGEEAPAGEPAAAEEKTPAGGLAAGKTFAIVTKSIGNPYNMREAEGFKEVIEAEGGACVVSYPEFPTAAAQVPILQSLISQEVDAIAIAANDASTLTEPLKEVADAGIKVCTLDSDLNADSRLTFCNQTSAELVGQTLVDAVYDLTGGAGQYAILSATTEATNQNAWIDAMKAVVEGDEKYADLELVTIAYGDDLADKSAEETKKLLADYPDLKVICAPTTVGLTAAAKVLADAGSGVRLTGLGLPSETAEYMGNDAQHPCPYMYLWNPIDLGRLAAYTCIALADGTITGQVGDTFEAGSLEGSPYTLVPLESDESASQIIMAEPFLFTPENIDEWKDQY